MPKNLPDNYKDSQILVVDDESPVIDLMGNFLSSMGFTAYHLARNGLEAIEVLESQDISVVISDMNMPKMDGMALLKYVRDHFPHIDVIIITGYGIEYSFMDVIEAGAIDYIRKPFSSEEMHAKLLRVLRERHIITSLQDEIASRKKLEQDLEKAMHRAEEANRAKSSFLAHMSHEIRTPMNAIIGMNHLALDCATTLEQKNYLEKVGKSADHLLCLLNDILDLSKIEAEKIELVAKPFDLRDELAGVMQIFAHKTHEKKIEMYGDLPPQLPDLLIGDSSRIRQVLINLLGNAVKFTHQGHIVARAWVESETDSSVQLRIEIEDTGIGIAQDKLDLIFDSFSQSDSSISCDYGGTGLGLAICRKLAGLMGGTISVKSTVGKGSCFSFTAQFSKNMVPCEQLARFQDTRVLHVCDNSDLRRVFTEHLEFWGITVRGVSLSEISDILADLEIKDKYQLILFDSGMEPEMVLQTIDGDWKNLKLPPIVPIFNSNDPKPCKVCTDKGIYFCLTRLTCMKDVRRAISAVLNQERCTNYNLFQPNNTSSPEHGCSLNLLLVEDNLFNQELSQILLEKAGHVVSVANNGIFALEMMAVKSYDLVLMDVMMPEMDGLIATRIIRRCEKEEAPGARDYQDLVEKLHNKIKGTHTPVIAMTAQAMTGDREFCLSAGMDDYLTKPIKLEELFAVLKRFNGKTACRSCVDETSPQATVVADNGRTPLNIDHIKEHLRIKFLLTDEKINFLIKGLKPVAIKQLSDAGQALSVNDMAMMAMTVHALKGSLANLGATEWAELAQQIETGAKNNLGSEKLSVLLCELRCGLQSIL
ncbi:MAG: response regulator [Proteobacteria bacterium]|nr:response regulator [Pseudomonadota bacterium]MBU1717077.1 response regulator [Pseudomonadota bacterium]